MKRFLLYICWCAFGNHNFQRLAGARSIARCTYCSEYKILGPLSFQELRESFVTVEMRLEFLTKEMKHLGATATEAKEALMTFSRLATISPQWTVNFDNSYWLGRKKS